ncbi:MAG: DNA polymerase III subunit delta [Alphaproteobacteria bacterium]|nr:DNA polymerase III subunit delta [Alphaproteobacteria bacterium]
MKLTWKQIEPFVKSPDPKARVVLVYGPDDGLMRERAKLIGKTIAPDLNDPFNVITLTTDQINEDPARLSDEAKAFSMMGGSRLIRIEGGADKLTPTIKEYLEEPSDENLVVIEAGELSTRSSLRKLCESAKNAAALPCYVEDERGVSQVIRQSLQDENLGIDADALNWLAANIAGDRGRVRGEINKLITYMGDDKNNVTIDDVQACCGEAGAGSIENLIYAVAGANPKTAITTYNQLLGDGVPVIVILRSLQNHFKRLHYVQAMMQDGKNTEQAVKSLQPPIFFKYESAFKGQINRWNKPKIDRVLSRLNELEAQTKQTGMPVETLCSQALLSLSSMR